MKSEKVTGDGINFFESEGKLKFELYSGVLKKAGLKVSEQLSKFAIVKT